MLIHFCIRFQRGLIRQMLLHSLFRPEWVSRARFRHVCVCGEAGTTTACKRGGLGRALEIWLEGTRASERWWRPSEGEQLGSFSCHRIARVRRYGTIHATEMLCLDR